MKHTHAYFVVFALAAGFSSKVTFAQSPEHRPADASTAYPLATTSSKPSAATRVEHWTRDEWNAAKNDWAKDKVKWASCRKQSSAQQLTGRKSWSFLYHCMTD